MSCICRETCVQQRKDFSFNCLSWFLSQRLTFILYFSDILLNVDCLSWCNCQGVQLSSRELVWTSNGLAKTLDWLSSLFVQKDLFNLKVFNTFELTVLPRLKNKTGQNTILFVANKCKVWGKSWLFQRYSCYGVNSRYPQIILSVWSLKRPLPTVLQYLNTWEKLFILQGIWEHINFKNLTLG